MQTANKMTPDFKRAAFRTLTGITLPTSGNVSIACPMPEHEDQSPSCSVAWDTRFCCHGCGARGDVVHLAAAQWNLDTNTSFRAIARRLESAVALNPLPSSDIDMTETVTQQPTSTTPSDTAKEHPLTLLKQRTRARARVLEYLVARGIAPATLERLPHQILDRTREGIRVFVELGHGQQGSVTRYIDDAGPKHKASASLPLVRLLREDGPRTLVITEGLFDAFTAAEFGFSAVSLPIGAKNVEKIERELRTLAATFSDVVIATDSDAAGEGAARKLVAILEEAGVPSIRRMLFPLDGATKDLNAILVSHGYDTGFCAIADAAATYSDIAGASWIDSDWTEECDPPREFLIDDLIARGERAFVVGAGDSLKTMACRGIALAAACEPDVVTDVGPFRVRGGHRVAWINEELPGSDFRRQLLRVARGMKASDATLKRISPANESGFVLGDKRSLARLARLLATPGLPWLVIVDSLRPILGGADENHGAVIAGHLRELRGVLAPSGATILIIAHEAKTTGKAKCKIAGSTATFDWADVVLNIERKGQEPAKITCGKGRNRKGEAEVGEFDIVDGADGALAPTTGEGVPVRVRGSAAPKLSRLAHDIANVLEADPQPAWTREAIRRGLGRSVAYPKLNAALAELVAAKRLLTDGDAKRPKYRLPPSPVDLRKDDESATAA